MKDLWNKPCLAEISHWPDDHLKKFLLSRFPPGEVCSMSRRRLELSAKAEMSRLCNELRLRSLLDLKGLNPAGCKDYLQSVQGTWISSPAQSMGHFIMAGPIEKGFNASFTQAELSAGQPSPFMALGFPLLPARPDDECRSDVFWSIRDRLKEIAARADRSPDVPIVYVAAAEDPTSVDSELLALVVQTVVAAKTQKEHGDVHMADGNLLPVVVVCYHSFNSSGASDMEVQLHDHAFKENLRTISTSGTSSTAQVPAREIYMLNKLLSKNRKLLHKDFVKDTENNLMAKLRVPLAWRVSVLTPVEGPGDWEQQTSGLRSSVKQSKRSLRSCHACQKSQMQVQESGQKMLCCSGCLAVWYCSKECQHKHWKAEHKLHCNPVESEEGLPSPQADWQRGDTVEVCGLSGATELNGSIGVLGDYFEDCCRWAVDLQGSWRKIKAENLRRHTGVAAKEVEQEPVEPVLCKGDTVEIFGLQTAHELNGSVGVLGEYFEDSSRWAVEVDSSWKRINATHLRRCGAGSRHEPAPKVCEVALWKGDAVEIVGLSKAVELNGSIGLLGSYLEESSRWAVRVQDSWKQIKADNLRQHVGRAKPQAAHSCGATMQCEDPKPFATLASFLLPLELSPTDSETVANIPEISFNGEMVSYNRMTKNKYGDLVFVIKCQFMAPELHIVGCGRNGEINVYDSLRSFNLMVFKDETGHRAKAYVQLAALARNHGGRVNNAWKVYLYAQRVGANLRIITARLPMQLQHF